ncbi:beta strand repeat-containing protein [Azospirillum rugosum]|uniref:Filamentous hemagglutinin family protein n=2 Tax=Azospirillum rugosum TaxID=416170 RepID=A0ABS4SLC2_9PROT|nr:filamentous hemagglutinin N-terminal domain-containing protein [Azospirillum rugosum]MBP2293277.1 filamentous hemagglutinin family protein [Azospirillum rugosum]
MPRTLLLTSLVVLLPQTAALAQIATDGTTGPRVSLSGGRIEVGAGLGTQAGGNLFHSFETFNVNRGQTVTFTGPDSVRHVVGRVTGGGSSTINGTLRSTVGQADVHLINPAGVTFGPNAVVDVPASLHVGTAHEVRFADGARFSALDRSGSTFTTAPPEAFGFLDRPAGALRVDQSRLTVKPGRALSLVGGDVAVSGGAEGVVGAPGGAVTVASVAGAGQMRLDDGTVAAAKQGTVRLHDHARIGAAGEGGGSVRIRGGALVVENATIATTNTGPVDGAGGIDVAAGSADIAGSTLASGTLGSGKGAPIRLRAGDLRLRDGTRVVSTSHGPGGAGAVTVNAGTLSVAGTGTTYSTTIESSLPAGATGQPGPVTVTADRLDVRGGGAIRSVTAGPAKAADVNVTAGDISLTGDGARFARSRIVSETLFGADGGTGAVTVTAAGALRLTDEGQIGSLLLGRSDAGPVTVRADSLTVAAATRDALTGVFSETSFGATGNAGLVDVRARSIDLSGPLAQLSSITFSQGTAGSVSVQADSLSVTGTNGQGFTGITSNAEFGSSGHAGTVTVVTTGPLALLRSGEIGSNTFGIGNAGDVIVRAGSLTIAGAEGTSLRTGIGSSAEPFALGSAGRVNVAVDGHLDLSRGGLITTDTHTEGNAGAVSVTAGSLSVTGNNGKNLTGISSNARSDAEGNAGTVSVTATGPLTVNSGGFISSDTFGGGNAGAVTVAAGSLTVDGVGANAFTGVSSDVEQGGRGNAGTVSVTAAGPLTLVGGGQIRSISDDKGNAGAVSVSAGSLSMERGDAARPTGILSDAYDIGNAGTIRVQTDGALRIGTGAWISSETYRSGNGGSIAVHAGSLGIEGSPQEPFTGIFTNTYGSGPAGTIDVATRGALSLDNRAQISSDTYDQGRAGSVTVAAGSVSVAGTGSEGFTGISSNALRGSDGHAGTVTVGTTGPLRLSRGGQISSFSAGSGDAGSVAVTAGSLALEEGIGTNLPTAILSDSYGTGDAGTVRVQTAGDLRIGGGTWISSETYRSGLGGAVTVRAGTLTIAGDPDQSFTGIFTNTYGSGRAGTIDVATTDALSLTNRSQISSDTYGSGGAGTVGVTAAGTLLLNPGGFISSDTYGRGNAGAVTVGAGNLMVLGNAGTDFTGISSNAVGSSEGQAGTVKVTAAGALTLASAGQIGTNTFSVGDAGSVFVQADTLAISGNGSPFFTGIFSSAAPGATGDGGAVTMQARTIRLDRDGLVATENFGTGVGGPIRITATDTLAFDGAAVRTRTAAGDGGDIAVQVGRLLDMRNSEVTTSVAGGTGSGGNIVIDPPFVVLQNSRIQANAQKGGGGNITVRADQLLTTPDTLIEASSAESVSGTISTPAPDNTIASSLVKLPESFLNTRDLLRDSCAGRGGRASSSLIVGNGGGLPLDPAGPLPSPYGGFRNGEPGAPHRGTGAASELPLRFHVAGTPGCG